jgi:leucine dehydrogenase
MSFKLFQEVTQRGHEQVTVFNDPKAGLKAIVSIHSTVLGPSLGGLRVYPYQSETAAFNDALRLSEAMSYKSAVAGMRLGGGKACIIADPKITQGRKELFESFARGLNNLGGRYITAEDMGTSAEDMQTIKQVSKHVVGFPHEFGGSGDPSPWTARGVMHGIIAACERRFGSREIVGKTIVIQGVGSVGLHLAKLLYGKGCNLVIADTSSDRLRNAESLLPKVKIVPVEAVYDYPCDVFAPCAIGQTVNSRTCSMLTCDIICGAANNQLSGPDVYEFISERGILYCPDFVVNAGGVISVGAELNKGGWDSEWVTNKVDQIFDTTARILEESSKRGLFPEVVAVDLAKEIIENVSGGGR